jgi:DNA primase
MANLRTLSFREAADIVKSSLNILNVVGRHVALKQRGRNYLGLCPFHREKTPSFNVNPGKNLYKCFGCGEAGDALGFLMKLERKTYPEIIRELAEEQGILIQEDPQRAAEATQRMALEEKIFALNAEALNYFEQQLWAPNGQKAVQYLYGRGMQDDGIRRFQLGYAPVGWENLTRHLLQTMPFLKEDPSLLIQAGLATAKQEGGSQYDRFRNRLMIPIHDDRGRVVGFGGRALSDEDQPKYLNSPETQVYQKNRILYGLHQAKTAVRTEQSAVIMEGYFDVISAQLAGVGQAVATCGTAMTESHLSMLVRQGVNTLYLAFDSDEAGRKAALGAITRIEQHLERFPVAVKVLSVPSGKDPDGYIREAGGEAFRHVLFASQDVRTFKFESALRGLDLTSAEGRIEAAHRVTPLLAAISQPVARSEFLARYAERLGVAEDALVMELRRYEERHPGAQVLTRPEWQTGRNKSVSGDAISEQDPSSYKRNQKKRRASTSAFVDNLGEMRRALVPRHQKAEREILTLLFVSPLAGSQMLASLQPVTLEMPTHQQLFGAVTDYLDLMADDRDALHPDRMLATLTAGFGAEAPEVVSLVADLSFAADLYREQAGLESASDEETASRVCRQMKRCLDILAIHHRQSALRQMNQQVSELEQARQAKTRGLSDAFAPETGAEDSVTVLELQYSLRDTLTRSRDELSIKPMSGGTE